MGAGWVGGWVGGWRRDGLVTHAVCYCTVWAGRGWLRRGLLCAAHSMPTTGACETESGQQTKREPIRECLCTPTAPDLAHPRLISPQRCRSTLVAAGVEPNFDESFLFNLQVCVCAHCLRACMHASMLPPSTNPLTVWCTAQPEGTKALADVTTLLKMREPIQIILCKVRNKRGASSSSSPSSKASGTDTPLLEQMSVDVLGGCTVEWRHALVR